MPAAIVIVSGPHGNGELERGKYVLERRKVTPHTKNIEGPFVDKATGKGFFIPLTPTFETTREGLGIHPDGNVPGTLGCIGITSDASSFYDKVAATPTSASIYVEVE